MPVDHQQTRKQPENASFKQMTHAGNKQHMSSVQSHWLQLKGQLIPFNHHHCIPARILAINTIFKSSELGNCKMAVIESLINP